MEQASGVAALNYLLNVASLSPTVFRAVAPDLPKIRTHLLLITIPVKSPVFLQENSRILDVRIEDKNYYY